MNEVQLGELKKYCNNNKDALGFLDNQLQDRVKDNKSINVNKIEHILDYIMNSGESILDKGFLRIEKNADKWIKNNIELAGNVVEVDTDVEIVLKRDELKVVKLIGESAFLREGKLMNHCVGGYSNKKDCDIYSIRDGYNVPHATIEVLNSGKGQINQIKGKGNGHIHPKYIGIVLDFLTKHLNLDIRESEMKNLGYIKVNNEEISFISDNFSNFKTITFKNTVFLCISSKIK